MQLVFAVVAVSIRRRVGDERLQHLSPRLLGPHVEDPCVQRVEKYVDRALRVVRDHRDARGLRSYGMRYGHVHRRIERLEFCFKVPILWRAEVKTLFDGKFDVHEDGPVGKTTK